MKLKDRVEKLAEHRRRNEGMGGPERVERQRAAGKLDARARLKLLFDPGTFEELGLLAAHDGNLPEEEEAGQALAGGRGHHRHRARSTAGRWRRRSTTSPSSAAPSARSASARWRGCGIWRSKNRIPMVWLVDSAGARLDASAGIDPRRIAGFADTGYLFREQVVMSGVVPQVAAMMGPGAAGTAYIPGAGGLRPMVKGTSSIAIGGPYLVESVVGEKVTEEELGGSKVHNELSGVADAEYADDEACLAAVREYLSFFPSHCEDKPPRRPDARIRSTGGTRSC